MTLTVSSFVNSYILFFILIELFDFLLLFSYVKFNYLEKVKYIIFRACKIIQKYFISSDKAVLFEIIYISMTNIKMIRVILICVLLITIAIWTVIEFHKNILKR